MMHRSYQRLVRLSTALESNGDIPGDVIAWLVDGIRQYRHGHQPSLDAALDLQQESGGYFKHPPVTERYTTRDELIRHLAHQYPGTDSARAAQAAEALQDGPEHSNLVAAIYAVGVNVPTSPRHVLRILRNL